MKAIVQSVEHLLSRFQHIYRTLRGRRHVMPFTLPLPFLDCRKSDLVQAFSLDLPLKYMIAAQIRVYVTLVLTQMRQPARTADSPDIMAKGDLAKSLPISHSSLGYKHFILTLK